METEARRREHYNLYYLFAEDQKAHLLARENAEVMGKTVLTHFLQRHSKPPLSK